MTCLTQALSLSSDPEMREAEIKALKDQIAEEWHAMDDAHATGYFQIATIHMNTAHRLQRRLDELEGVQ